jgi:hypothetical protein
MGSRFGVVGHMPVAKMREEVAKETANCRNGHKEPDSWGRKALQSLREAMGRASRWSATRAPSTCTPLLASLMALLYHDPDKPGSVAFRRCSGAARSLQIQRSSHVSKGIQHLLDAAL